MKYIISFGSAMLSTPSLNRVSYFSFDFLQKEMFFCPPQTFVQLAASSIFTHSKCHPLLSLLLLPSFQTVIYSCCYKKSPCQSASVLVPARLLI